MPIITAPTALSAIKIRSIVATPLFGESPKGGWSAEIKPEDSIHALIAVHTDAGITGYGSVFTDGRLVQAGLKVLEPLFLGENALEPERVTEKMHQNTFWMGRGGTLTHTISGIDIALWDILGKATGMPVGRLLGGCYRTRVQPYCSLLMDQPEQMSGIITPHRERGFKAFKIGWGPFGRAMDSKLDERIIRAARQAAGDDAQLFVDAGASDAHWPHGLKWALRTADMLANYGIGWFEEALKPDAIDDFCELRRRSPVPIAGGEVLTRRQAFLPWLTRGAFDIVQPDVTKVGGISEERRIGWLAQEHGVRFIPHGWNTAVGLAADLQLASAFAGTDLVEYITGSAYVDDIVAGGWTLDEDGLLPIPAAPGLGIALDLDAVGRFARDARLLTTP